MGICKTLMNKKEKICISNQACKYNETTWTHFIKAPFPEMICLNVNWHSNEVPYMDTLKFCTSIPQKFQLQELFQISEQDSTSDEYILKAVVCFLGAHYMTYIKDRTVPDKRNENFPIWKLYDDYKPIDIYYSWKDIIEKILDFGTLPTVLIYQKVNPQNQDDD